MVWPWVALAFCAGLLLGAFASAIGVALWWVMLVTKLDCIHLALSASVLRDELAKIRGNA